MNHTDLIPHLFRNESGKITAVLTKMLGIENISVAEDISGETFLAALETWPYEGIPENPAAWLYMVAKNKAKNNLKRNQLFRQKIAGEINQQHTTETEIDFSDSNIKDSTLQMLFAICHPSINTEAQIGLALRILCGFGIEEIANAFLSNKETINKRLFRAREKLREANVRIEIPGTAAIDERLSAVLTTLYLLFNEGYYSESCELIIRRELCEEAMRLTEMLIDNHKTNKPGVNALMALMCFHSSRLDARISDNGELVLYDNQDEDLWSKELIAKGAWYFKQASKGNYLSKYHLEAGIAYWYTVRDDNNEKWENILQLYNRLLQLQYSPVAALNRTYALSKARGNEIAINEAQKLQLNNNRFFHMLLGKLYAGVNREKSVFHFNQAICLIKSAAEKRAIERQVSRISENW